MHDESMDMNGRHLDECGVGSEEVTDVSRLVSSPTQMHESVAPLVEQHGGSGCSQLMHVLSALVIYLVMDA